MALGDVLDLSAYFRSGAIAPPLYEPAWVRNQATLATFLVYSIFTTRLTVDMDLADFREAHPEASS